MRLQEFRQVDVRYIQCQHYDAIITASGYESRCTYIAKQLDNSRTANRIALSFCDRRTETTESNDTTFRELGYDLFPLGSNHSQDIREVLSRIVSSSSTACINILLDYSSMSRRMLASCLDYARNIDIPGRSLTLSCAYCSYSFTQPNIQVPNESITPIDGFCSLQPLQKTTALVIGLGHTAKRALGLTEYIDPAETSVFYTDPALDYRYVESICENNKDLIQRLGESNIFTYPADNLSSTYVKLSSLCHGLLHDHRVILAPIGPKPFALVCMLLALQVPDIDVWQVSSGPREVAADRVSSGQVIACNTVFGD